MANKIKKKIPTPPDPAKLKPEKEAQVSVKEIVKDERSHKIAGAISLLVCIFLFIAFTSYLFTWQEDQSQILSLSGIKLFRSSDVHVSNLLGVLGAFTAHNLIYNGFGLPAYLLCTFFFVLGVNLLFEKKVFSLARNLKYVIVGLLVLSVAFAFFAGNSGFSWGGAVGELLTAWLEKWIGETGTGVILGFAALIYIIWRFNPSFKIPVIHKKVTIPAIPAENETADTDEAIAGSGFFARGEPGYKNDPDADSTNKLKQEGSGLPVVLPLQPVEKPDPLHQFGMFEKEQSGDNNALPLQNDSLAETSMEEAGSFRKGPETPKKGIAPVDLDLEIKEPTTEDDLPEKDFPERPQHLKDFDPILELRDYRYPSLDLLETHGSDKIVQDPAELEANKNQIILTLKNYDIEIQRISATVGPTVTLYEIIPAPGVRISRIKNLEDDIALSLAALGIRIIAPIPGKGTIGIEVPNVRKSMVSMKTLLASDKFQNNHFSLPIAIGKKIDNENFIVDLASMPHLLMAGATGQGKSVGINTILVSLLYKKHPSQLKLVLVDPKKVELSLYRIIEKHFLAKLPGEEESIITDTKKVVYTLNALCIEMDNRYDLLKEAGCRNIKEYNEKFVKRRLNPQKGHQFLPFIVLVIDEFADLIMTAGKEIEMPIARLAQLARAVGIHLIIATQRPSVNIITGTIKANFPARIAFKVSSKIDSRTILDVGGAEQLIGKGDMLISYNGEITRLQCAFVDTPEVDKLVEFIGYQESFPEQYYLPLYEDEKEMDAKNLDPTERDALFEDAAKLIVANQVGSTSLIQRKMKLGYNRAGRLMDQLEAAGIVGKSAGSKAREVLVKTDHELQEILGMI